MRRRQLIFVTDNETADDQRKPSLLNYVANTCFNFLGIFNGKKDNPSSRREDVSCTVSIDGAVKDIPAETGETANFEASACTVPPTTADNSLHIHGNELHENNESATTPENTTNTAAVVGSAASGGLPPIDAALKDLSVEAGETANCEAAACIVPTTTAGISLHIHGNELHENNESATFPGPTTNGDAVVGSAPIRGPPSIDAAVKDLSAEVGETANCELAACTVPPTPPGNSLQIHGNELHENNESATFPGLTTNGDAVVGSAPIRSPPSIDAAVKDLSVETGETANCEAAACTVPQTTGGTNLQFQGPVVDSKQGTSRDCSGISGIDNKRQNENAVAQLTVETSSISLTASGNRKYDEKMAVASSLLELSTAGHSEEEETADDIMQFNQNVNPSKAFQQMDDEIKTIDHSTPVVPSLSQIMQYRQVLMPWNQLQQGSLSLPVQPHNHPPYFPLSTLPICPVCSEVMKEWDGLLEPFGAEQRTEGKGTERWFVARIQSQVEHNGQQTLQRKTSGI
jgi:hypothetical protein